RLLLLSLFLFLWFLFHNLFLFLRLLGFILLLCHLFKSFTCFFFTSSIWSSSSSLTLPAINFFWLFYSLGHLEKVRRRLEEDQRRPKKIKEDQRRSKKIKEDQRRSKK